MTQEQTFTGFSKRTIDFLNNLKTNNNKRWFEKNKEDYNHFLLKPLRNLVTDMGYFMLGIDSLLEVTPAVNKTISRIYRDTRFSRDKSLFKTTMWITFKRPSKYWKDAPAYFFEISSNSYRFGMGLYNASPETMSRFRDAIDNNEKDFLKAISFFSKQQIFVIEGEKYKKLFNINKPDNIQEFYQRKNLYLVCNRKIDNCLFQTKLVDDLRFGFKLLEPLYNYLWRIKGK